MANPFKLPGDLYFSGRSRYARRTMYGVPPSYLPPPEVHTHRDGRITVAGTILPKFTPGNASGEQSLTPIPGKTPVRPMPEYSPQYYGDAIVFPIVFGAAGELLILPRPSATRISLLIVNSTVVGNIFYTFDRVADPVSCVPIVAGGNRLFDSSVPQGDLHVFSTGAGTVIVEFMNRDITQESYR